MKKSLLTLACLSLLAINGCNGNGDDKKPEENQQNQQNHDSNSDKQDAATDKADDSATDKNDDNNQIKEIPTYDMVIDIKAGDPCKPTIENLGICADDNSLWYCEYGSDDWDDGKWVLKKCDQDQICGLTAQHGDSAVMKCLDICDPAKFDETERSCESFDDNLYEYRSFECLKYKDKFVAKEVYKYCSKCGEDNKCIVDDKDRGLNAKPGDPCNYYLFENHCSDNNNAIICYPTTEDNQINNGIVMEKKCQDDEKCVADPWYDTASYMDYSSIYCIKRDQKCDPDTYEDKESNYVVSNSDMCMEIQKIETCNYGTIINNFAPYIILAEDVEFYQDCLAEKEDCKEDEDCFITIDFLNIGHSFDK